MILNLLQEFFLGLGHLGLPLGMGELLGSPPFLGHLLGRLGFVFRILADGSMGLLIHILNAISGDAILDELGELFLVSVLILFEKVTHVIGNMLTKDVGTMDVGVEFALLLVISGEPLFAVRNVEAAVGGSFHGAKDFGTSGGSGQANIEAGMECTGAFIVVFNHEKAAIDFSVALVGPIQVQFLEELQWKIKLFLETGYTNGT